MPRKVEWNFEGVRLREEHLLSFVRKTGLPVKRITAASKYMACIDSVYLWLK